MLKDDDDFGIVVFKTSMSIEKEEEEEEDADHMLKGRGGGGFIICLTAFFLIKERHMITCVGGSHKM
jgi:hypothetical protein